MLIIRFRSGSSVAVKADDVYVWAIPGLLEDELVGGYFPVRDSLHKGLLENHLAFTRPNLEQVLHT